MTESSHQSGHNKKPVLATIITLIAVVIMCGLGTWQLERGEEKKDRLAQIEARKNEKPIDIDALMGFEGDIRDIPFSLNGRVMTDKAFLVDNKLHKGQVGYQVLVPVEMNQGVILVNFGWIKGGQYRDEIPSFVLPQGMVTLDGVVSVPQLNPVVRETAINDGVWPKVIQQTDLPLLEEFVDTPLAGFVMLLSPEHSEGFERNWQPVVMSPQKHLGYAIQWYGLALASILVYVFALRGRFQKDHE